MKLPDKAVFASPDSRRVGQYAPTLGLGYRVIRTVRTRRGLGTIIHTLTTFTANKKRAHRLASTWAKKPVDAR